MNLQTRSFLRTALVVGALMLGVAAMAGPSRSDTSPDTLLAVGSTNNNANPNCNGKNNDTCAGDGPIKNFHLTLGAIPEMFPGSSTGLTVNFGNPHAFPIKVQNLTVSAELANPGEDCPLNQLQYPGGTTSYSPAIVVPAGGSVVATPLRVGLKSTADDRCERAEFTIHAVATAVK